MERTISSVDIELHFDGSVLWADFECPQCKKVHVSIDAQTFPEVTPQLFVGRIFAIHGKHFFPDYPMSAGQVQPRRM